MAATQALYPEVIKDAVTMFDPPRPAHPLPGAGAGGLHHRRAGGVVVFPDRADAAGGAADHPRLAGADVRHLTRADLARVEREAPATLASRFTTDAATIREALTRAVNGLADAVTIVGLVGWMIYADWVLSLIAFVLLPIAAVPIQRIGRRIRRASGGMQERVGETAALLNESFAQARTVRAYRLEAQETRRAEAAFERLYRSLMSMSRSRARIDPLLEMLGGLAVAAVLGFAGWRAALGSSSIGDFAGFVAALLIASRPLRALGSLNAALQEGLAGLARVFAVIDEAAGHRRAARGGGAAGRARADGVRGCAFLYPDGRHALHGLPSSPSPG